jgi:transposase-like protein
MATKRKTTGNAKLTDELAAKAIALAGQGAYQVTVAQLIGITRQTLHAWLNEYKREPYLDFAKRYREAEAEAEHELAERIRTSPDPVDAKWFLARRYPDRWAEKKSLDLNGSVDFGVKLDASAFTDPAAREHVLGLIDYLSTDDDTESQSGPQPAGETGDQ